MYIHQRTDWPEFTWRTDFFATLLGDTRHQQGLWVSEMLSLNVELRDEANLNTLTSEIVQSSRIEGEYLNSEEVRSSVARRLGLETAEILLPSREIDGIVEMLLDATQNYEDILTHERLFAWHSALFPIGRSGSRPITVGAYRKDENGPMQLVSGGMGEEKVHFEAPNAPKILTEMNRFLFWFNAPTTIDPIIKAAIAHFWFITIHPMDDGNGRMARAIAEIQLSRTDRTNQRFYSMSTEIELHKKEYYDILERTQSGDLDITEWITWFFDYLHRAILTAPVRLARVYEKAHFWQAHRNTPMNTRQRKIVLRLQDDFFGKLSTGKYAKMFKC